MNNRTLTRVLGLLDGFLSQKPEPAMIKIGKRATPFEILVGCLISSRTRDEVTESSCNRLFKKKIGPADLVRMTPRQLEKALYPVAFYRNKAKSLKRLCQDLLERYEGQVPDSMEELLTLAGVGRKTANLTLILAFDGMGICVDTHVHRLCNRWGYVATDSPEETEKVLRKQLPSKHWKKLNFLLVGFGQICCRPVSPLCSQCPVDSLCPRIGVDMHR